jgi:hypothetical protein
MPAPKVFISHASEDKQRFVIPFAEGLRAKGVDAWVDEWEIAAGDSLVQKIFEVGIKEAAAIVVVLSRISVEKRWVREELDAAVVARVNKATRLIPIVIDECAVPVVLQATKWIKLKGNNVQSVVDEVVQVMFGASGKPPLGPPPQYAQSPVVVVDGLEPVDNHVLAALGEIYAAEGRNVIGRERLMSAIEGAGISEDQLLSSLDVLETDWYIEGLHGIGGKFHAAKLTRPGTEAVWKARLTDYEERYRLIAAHLANNDGGRDAATAEALGLPLVFVEFVVDDLESQGLIRVSSKVAFGMRHVISVSEKLKRSLR